MDVQKCDLLIAEDDPAVALFLERAFDKVGLVGPLCHVSNGAAVIAYLKGEGVYADRKKHPLPTVILLKFRLPEKSAVDVLGWLRKQPEICRIPVVVLAGIALSEDINAAYQAGANSVLIMPSNAELFVELLRSIRQYWLVINRNPVSPKNGRKVKR